MGFRNRILDLVAATNLHPTVHSSTTTMKIKIIFTLV